MGYLYYYCDFVWKTFLPRGAPWGYRYSMQKTSQGARILDFPTGIDRIQELQLRVTPVGSIHFVWGQAKFSI